MVPLIFALLVVPLTENLPLKVPVSEKTQEDRLARAERVGIDSALRGRQAKASTAKWNDLTSGIWVGQCQTNEEPPRGCLVNIFERREYPTPEAAANPKIKDRIAHFRIHESGTFYTAMKADALNESRQIIGAELAKGIYAGGITMNKNDLQKGHLIDSNKDTSFALAFDKKTLFIHQIFATPGASARETLCELRKGPNSD
jgi:hypothetical protein